MFRLDGSTAIITGAAGILGKHFSLGFSKFGAKLALVDSDENALADLSEFLRDHGVSGFRTYVCDVTDYSSIQITKNQVVTDFGNINILLNNAASKGLSLEKFFAKYEDYELEQWQSVMDVNINGMFLMSQAIGPEIAKNANGGSIIQVASIYGELAPDNRIYEGSEYLGMQINTPAVYTASKAAVIGLTKYLATYWASNQVRVNTLTPGGIQSGQNDKFIGKYSERIPLNRMARPEEMVGAAIYLASPASSYVTGQNLMIDGGLSAW